MNNITPGQKVILEKYRGIFIKINAKVVQTIRPELVRLMIENINNLRNVAIISGAIASFTIYIYSSTVNDDNFFLRLGIVGLLLNIIFIIVYLNKNISKGINSYFKLINEEISVGDKGQRIIENIYNTQLNLSQGYKDLEEVLNEIDEKSKLRERVPHGKDFF